MDELTLDQWLVLRRLVNTEIEVMRNTFFDSTDDPRVVKAHNAELEVLKQIQSHFKFQRPQP